MRRLLIVLLILFIILLLLIGFFRIADGEIARCRYIESGGGRPEATALRQQLYVNDILLVRNDMAEAALVVLDAESNGAEGREVELDDPAQVADYINDWYCPPTSRSLDADDLRAVVASETWTAVADGLDLVVLPEELDVTAALTVLDGAGVEASPVHLLETENHVGALPGTAAVLHDRDADAPDEIEVAASPVRIALIDTGFTGISGVVKGVGLPERGNEFSSEGVPLVRLSGEDAHERGAPGSVFDFVRNVPDLSKVDDHNPRGSADCRASHGEFVASMVRQIQPTAQIIGVNALAARGEQRGSEADCQVTDEVGVAVAMARLEIGAPEGGYDGVNLSLGTIPHTMTAPEGRMTVKASTPWSLDEAFGQPDLGWAGKIYAAGGNTETLVDTDHAEVESAEVDFAIYPAAYPNVTGVAALSTWDQVTVWDTDETPEVLSPAYPWMEVGALGCDLLGRASGRPNEMWRWSGSSFASPIALALATDVRINATAFTTQSVQPSSIADRRVLPGSMTKVVGTLLPNGPNRTHCPPVSNVSVG